MNAIERPWRDVGAVEDFQERNFRIVTINSQEFGVLHFRDRYYAVRNVCPHAWGPLCRGPVEQRLAGDVGSPALGDEHPVVACPWHGWEFDLRDGKCVSDPAWSVKTFPARADEGRVLVQF